MSVSRRGTPATNINGSGSSISINVPSGVQDGDCLVLIISRDSSRTVSSGLTGWTLQGSQTLPGGASVWNTSVYTRVASSEPGSYTINWSGSCYSDASMSAYQGNDATTPIPASNSFSTNSGTGTTATMTGTGLSAPATGCYLVAFSAGDNSARSGVFGGMTNRVDFDGNNYVDDEALSASGTVGDRTATWPSQGWSAIGLLIQPSAGGTDTPKTVTVTQTQTPTVQRAITRAAITATQTQTPSRIRAVAKSMSATSTQTPSRVSGAGHAMTITATQTQSTPSAPTVSGDVTITATHTQTPTVQRALARNVSVTQTQTPTRTRAATRTITTTQTQTPSQSNNAPEPPPAPTAPLGRGRIRGRRYP